MDSTDKFFLDSIESSLRIIFCACSLISETVYPMAVGFILIEILDRILKMIFDISGD